MLEDHVGDIISKARTAAGVSIEDAAKTIGLSVEDLQALEETGETGSQLDFQALAEMIHLNVAKLSTIVQGWSPAPKDLAQWCELRVITTTRHDMAVNCYLVWDEVSREAALFDTGWDPDPVLKLIAENSLELKHLFLTHSHEDHIAALEPIQKQFPKARFHTNDATAPPQHRNRANDFIHLGSLRITNRPTPGHADDGVIYIIGTWPEDAPHVGIIGDTIFAGSLARGFVSTEQLKQAVVEQIFTLPSDTLLCPGHGPLTTVAEEKENNPFF